MKSFKLWIIFIITLLGCESEVQIEPYSDFKGKLHIEGLLQPGKSPRIFVEQSFPFFDQKVTPQQVFARGATVILTENNETEVLLPDSIFDSFRCRWLPFYGGSRLSEFGKTYSLHIEFEGDTFIASTRINQTIPTIEDIIYTPEFFDIYGGHDGVKIILQDFGGTPNYYRFQMNRKIDRTVAHAHVLDVVTSNCTGDEEFWITDLGRTVFNDHGNDGGKLELLVEVSFEYSKGDSTWITIQSLDEKSAAFYQELDDQLVSILNPFVEPVFLKSYIAGATGVFGSIVLSDSVLFIYPQDHPL